jgi:hypothetical protein
MNTEVGLEDKVVPIICKTGFPVDTKFAIVGGVSIAVGITSLILGAYKRGAGDFHDSELQALRKVGAINWPDYKELLYYDKDKNKKGHAKSNFLIFNKKIFKK